MKGKPGNFVLPAILGWLFLSFYLHETKAAAQLAEGIHQIALQTPIAGAASFSRFWASKLTALGIFAVFQACCLVLGAALALLAGFSRRQRQGPLLALPLGWVLMGFQAFALALCGLSSPAVLVTASLASAFLLAGNRTLSLRSAGLTLPAGGTQWFPAAAASIALLAVVIASLAPEVEVDPLTYHLAGPQAALFSHKLVPGSFNLFDHLPPLYEMLVTPLLAAGGEAAAKWMNPFLLAYAAAAVFMILRRSLSPAWAWVGAALLLSNPFLSRQAIMAKNDLLIAAFGLAAFIWIVETRTKTVRRFLLAGFLCGAAFAVKYTGAYLLLAIAAVPVSRGLLARKNLIALSAGFLLVSLPVMCRNFIVTNDPVYPSGFGIVSSPFFSATAKIRLKENLYGVTSQDPAAISKVRNLEGFWKAGGGEESFLRWAIFLPALLLVRVWPPILASAAAVLLVLMASWIAGPPQVRYAAAAFPFGVMLSVLAVSSLRPGRFPVRGLIITAALAFQVLHTVFCEPLAQAYRAGLGIEPAESYRARTLTTLHETTAWMNDSGRLILHGESRGYIFRCRTDTASLSSVSFLPYSAVHSSRTVSEVWKKFRQQGWTRMLYNRLGAFFWRRSMGDDPWTERELALWARFWRTHAQLAAESSFMDIRQGHFYLFRFVPRVDGEYRAVLPGIEGPSWAAETLMRSGDLESARNRFQILRRACKGFGIVDRIEAEMFWDSIPRTRRRLLLENAMRLGVRSPYILLNLAGIAEDEGRSREAKAYMLKAKALEPGTTAPGD